MKKSFIVQIFSSLILAVVIGLIFKEKASVLQPLGDLFLRLIQFIVVPLIFSTLVAGITSSGNMKKLGRLGGKTIVYYLVTSLIAVSIGLLAGKIFSPGSGLNIELDKNASAPSTEFEGIISTLLNIIPVNPLAALSTGAILQIIFFAIFLGVGIISAGDKAVPLKNLFESIAEVMYKITGIVMKLVPLGILGLLAPIVGSYGLPVLLPLIKLILAMLVAAALHVFITYSVAVRALGKMNPIRFLKGIFPAATVAFSTCSSSGTLPVTMKNTEENLGVSRETTSFVLPLGATVNMDGTAIYQGIAALFIAQYFGIELTMVEILTIALVATLASIGTAGVPGAGMIMLAMVLSAVNLPLEGIALVAGIDRILDMIRTPINIIGDASACVVVEKSEQKSKVV